MANDNSLIILIKGSAKDFLSEVDKIKKANKELNDFLGDLAKKSGAAFLGLTATIATVTKQFADFETALVGVGKTTDIEGKALDNFGKKIQDLSKRIPVAANELLGIAQAAGQLGVSGEQDLLKFTETIAKLGSASNLAGDEAATVLTRILTVTGEGVGNIDRFAAAIVDLGNNFAATESEIARMANEVARSTGVFNVSATEAAGLGTALRAVGVRAELGGSVIGRAFQAIDKAVRGGGRQFRELQTLTGLTGDQLKKTFEDDALRVFQLFTEGLGEANKAGQSTQVVLERFGLAGDEVNKVIPVLAKNTDLLARTLTTARTAYSENTALNIEAAKAFATLNSRTTILKNNVTALAVEFGEIFARDVARALEVTLDIVKAIQGLDKETKENIASLIKWAAIVAGTIAAVATFALGISKLVGGFLIAKVAILKVGAIIGGLVALLNPVGLAIAGVTAAIGLAYAATKLFSSSNGPEKLPENIDEINKRLDENIKKQKAVNKELENASEIQLANNAVLQKKQEELGLLDEEIKKLQELRQAKIRASEDFGTGALITQAQGPTSLDLSIPTVPDVTVPFKTEQAGDTSDLDALKSQKESEQAVIDEATQNRIDALRNQNAILLTEQNNFRIAEGQQLTAKEEELLVKQSDFAKKREELRLAEVEAQEIQDEQEKMLALQNVQLKNESLLLEEIAFNSRKAQVQTQERERKKALDDELRALDLETVEALNAEDLEVLTAQLQTKQELNRQFAQQEIARSQTQRQQHFNDEKRFGKAVADLKQFFNSQEVQGVKSTTSDLAQLQQSSSKKQQAIGKAAARVNAAIKTAEGAISAYTSLAAIPFVGPALGAAAAAALIAFGVEQQRKIDSTPTMQRGGFVPNLGGTGGARDRIPTLLEPNELVVPSSIAPDFIQAVGRPDITAGDNRGGGQFVEIGFTDNAFEIIERKRQERIALGSLE